MSGMPTSLLLTYSPVLTLYPVPTARQRPKHLFALPGEIVRTEPLTSSSHFKVKFGLRRVRPFILRFYT